MVYVFLADGFEEIEALSPVDLLRRANIEVKTVGVLSECVEGAHGIKVLADIYDENFTLPQDAQMIVLPGGMPGTTNLAESDIVKNVLAVAKEKDVFVCAICAAPMVLCQDGFLQGENATIFPGMESELVGANWVNEPVVQSRKVITAQSAGVAPLFAVKLIEVLKGKTVSEKIKNSIYPNW